MWHRIMTVSLSIAMAGTALAQQNDDDAKRNEDAQRLGQAVRARVEAQRAQVERAALDADRARADMAQKQAEEQFIQAQQRLTAQQDATTLRYVHKFAAARATKKEKVTYCGISTTEPPAVLIDQLKLTRGIGLVVDFVESGSPAEIAGLKQYDVITQLNDQLLTNSEQLGVLVRLKKPSDDAKLSVIRQGQPTSINVELGQKEMEVEVEVGNANVNPDLQAERMFALGTNGQLAIAPTVMAGGRFGGGGGMAFTNVTGTNQSVWSDDQHNLTLDLKNGKATRMTARDKAGKEIFNGPVETDEQRKALPADLGETLKKAEAGGPLHQYGIRMMGRNAAARPRVLTCAEGDTLLLARFENGKPTHAFAFSTTDGKTLFDGPTTNDEQRKAIPETVAKQLDLLEKNQAAASEFGVVGRN